jgi:predicted RNA-binding Zn-ribbon protein involved in translation (DUF1610 family)
LLVSHFVSKKSPYREPAAHEPIDDERPTLQELVQRGVIKELNPAFARKAIEGYEDVLTPAAEVQEAFYRQFACPGCGCTNLTREYFGGPRGQGVTWTEETLPNAMLRCSDCGLLFNPQSGMVIEPGESIQLPEMMEVPGLTRK